MAKPATRRRNAAWGAELIAPGDCDERRITQRGWRASKGWNIGPFNAELSPVAATFECLRSGGHRCRLVPIRCGRHLRDRVARRARLKTNIVGVVSERADAMPCFEQMAG